MFSLFAEFIANDKPIIAVYKGEVLVPVLVDYPESKFGGFLAVTDYKDPVILDEIAQNGWALWPPISYSYQSINRDYPRVKNASGQCLGFPGPPPWSTRAEPCEAPPDQIERYKSIGNYNWLGTDDQGRDVLARLIYGFRISVLFGLLLTIFSSIIGVTAGAAQGYFGGRVDLVFQRFLEIWSSIPSLFVLIIISSVLVPGFWTLLGVLMLFHWVVPGGRGARRVPARPQFRVHHGGARARAVQRQDHVQAPAAERDGGDADLPALQAVGLDHGADGAGLPGARACRPARRRWASCWRRARPTCRRRGWVSPRSSRSPACSACSSSSARACAMRSTRARPSSEGADGLHALARASPQPVGALQLRRQPSPTP